jgi:hypothetical protein
VKVIWENCFVSKDHPGLCLVLRLTCNTTDARSVSFQSLML